MNNRQYLRALKAAGTVTGISLLTLPIYAQTVEKNDEAAKTERVATMRFPYKVSGRVVKSDTGTAFAGVRISSPNLKVSAMTDEEGRYEISLPDLNVPLVVEAPGCSRQVVPLRGRETVDITVIMDAGYGYYDFGYGTPESESFISGFADGTVNFADDLNALLNGQVRTVKSSGAPGAGSSFFIRGLNSLNLSAQPLFIVDGIVWQMQETAVSVMDNFHNNPLNLIDPDDIDKVTVLKNGSAVWGAKAANGVVIIETKRGRDMATKIEANLSVGFQTPFKSIPVMDASAYKLYATDVMRGMNASDIAKFHFINDDPSKSYYWDTHNNTDWLDEVNRTSMIQNYGISVSGGDDIALYRFSLGYAKNDGNIDGTSFDRLNVRFNSDIHLMKNFDVVADIAYAQTSTNAIFDGLDEVRSPYYMSLVKSPLYGPWQRNGSGMLTNRLSDTDELNVGNPLALVGDGIPSLDKYRFNLNLAPTYKFSDKLSLSAAFGFSWDKANEDVFIPDAGVADEPLYNSNGEIYATALNEVRNFMSRQSTLSADLHVDWTILSNYQNELKTKIGGYFYNNYYKYTAGRGYNTGSDFMKALANTNSNLRFLDGDEYTDREGTWYLDADYSYLSKYFLNVGMSLASSSRFGSDAGGLDLCGTNWAFFPSVSASWLISSEKFMKHVHGIDNLKLRASFSVTGNDRLPVFANRTYQTSNAFAQNTAGLVLANIGNEKLKWETTSRFNVGLDASLLNNRLTLAADVYFAKTKDLLTYKPLNDVAGLEYFWDNNGEMTNNGFEVAVNAKIIDRKDFKFNIGASAGHYVNKITKLNNGSFITDVCNGQILTEEGRSAGVFYGYRTAGVFSDAAEAANANLAIKTESGQIVPFGAGDMIFVDKDHNGFIDKEDRVVLGDPNPDVYGNFTFDIRYKRFDLSALFTYSCGNDAYNALRASLESGSNIINQSTSMENRWTADGQHTNIPRATYGDPMGNARFSDRWIEDASYLKFKSLSLSYNVPLKVNFIQSLSVWGAVDNLFTLTKYLGADPEFSFGPSVLWQGVDAGLTPQTRSFRIGVKISL
ncbi:MAG: SusC/RagA family TonB-linked outer membrane protein [Prevotellaceae bacterium]|nr:SusC/RagA family TonB-linked outer membrane protein [Prevotellaceae bacterium]